MILVTFSRWNSWPIWSMWGRTPLAGRAVAILWWGELGQTVHGVVVRWTGGEHVHGGGGVVHMMSLMLRVVVVIIVHIVTVVITLVITTVDAIVPTDGSRGGRVIRMVQSPMTSVMRMMMWVVAIRIVEPTAFVVIRRCSIGQETPATITAGRHFLYTLQAQNKNNRIH